MVRVTVLKFAGAFATLAFRLFHSNCSVESGIISERVRLVFVGGRVRALLDISP